ncbi:hypothetical protein FYJ43_06375 [Cutibacterium sp. WCA-380-WT-3A]|uniref:Uncharacterized protein n=1 Tax=Cutibacterium porci TaxID=2605781 RepID=A0A7K0J754_9ACTN|nr:hypothetical protein [Cutibacterium porci]MSS45673.1 hypothetical protein [Cutibacterium porci]
MSSNPWPPEAIPLQSSDPPRVDEFWLDARALATPSGTVFFAHDDDGQAVLVIVLSHGAAGDPASWDRLAGEVNHLHSETVIARGGAGQNTGRLAGLYRPVTGPDEDAQLVAPWVALVNDGSPAAVAESRRILDAVDMSVVSGFPPAAGPNFRLHWIDDTATGLVRTWPLPWPGRRDKAGWSTTVVAWLLTLFIALTGLLIAVLLFQNVPPTPPPPPVPTSGSSSSSANSSSSPTPGRSSGQSSSPSSSSNSASPSKGQSPSSASKTPSTGGSESPTPSNNPSMSPSRTPSMQSPGAGTGTSSGSPTGRGRL